MSNAVRKRVVRKYYSIRADSYDQQKSRTWKSKQGFGAPVFDEILNALDRLDGKLLLEVGIGSGRNAKPVLEKMKPFVVGLDLCREMLRQARNKLSAHNQHFNLILGDGENMPFPSETFNAVICVSTMHYFQDQVKVVEDFAKLLKDGGIFVYGDLSPHERDREGFFDELERTLSKAHAEYYRASEMKKILRTHGFQILRMKSITYRKLYKSLMEDKGKYFGIKSETLRKHIISASKKAKEQYDMTENDLSLSYTILVAKKTQTEWSNVKTS